MVCIIVELSITDALGLQILIYLNYVFCFVYFLELVLKMIGLRHYYFLSKWNLFDFAVFLVSVVDVILELALPMDQENVAFPPVVFRVVSVLRILRVGRVLRLFKVCTYVLFIAFCIVYLFTFISMFHNRLALLI